MTGGMGHRFTSAFKISFGLVLVGAINTDQTEQQVTTYCASILTGDDLLRKFWEVRTVISKSQHCPLMRSVVQHFNNTHTRNELGRFIMPLPRKDNATPLGESRSKVAKRFLNLERLLVAKGSSPKLIEAMHECFEMGHAEPVHVADLGKDCKDVYYLPMHVVTKASRTTTKFCIVFDAKTDTGVSLNDQFLVGPRVHSSLVDILLHFPCHKIALTVEVSICIVQWSSLRANEISIVSYGEKIRVSLS